MLQQLQPLLPKEWRVYVLFDSWYASAKLLKFVRRQGKRWFVWALSNPIAFLMASV
ncbi:hypothetical protein [Acaryochloris sp. CCMEE 5410]|nr:hypothetical protein [Acaryochloris sp. CCMEE 5410]